MKKIYLSIVAAVSLMFVSCTADWLNTDPSTAVPSDDAIKNIDDAQVALNGIYRLASAHSYYGDNYLYYADCRGEDVQARINKGGRPQWFLLTISLMLRRMIIFNITLV